jgi:predicted GTPase
MSNQRNYSDRFKEKEITNRVAALTLAPTGKSTVSVKSFTDFPSLGATNAVVAKPQQQWAQKVKDSLAAAEEKAQKEKEKAAAEKSGAYRYSMTIVPLLVPKVEMAGHDYEDYEDLQEEEEEEGQGTPLYGNRGSDEDGF